MTKLYQFRGEVFVYGNQQDWEPGRGEWLLTVETDAELTGDTVFKMMLIPAEAQVTKPKKPNFIARIFA